MVADDPDKQRIVIEEKGRGLYELNLTQREHQHFGHGYAVTAQRADAFPIINAQSWRVNTSHLTFAYIAASRTSGAVIIVIDGLDKLTEALEARSGQQIAALDQEKDTEGLAEMKVREMAVERNHRPADGECLKRDGDSQGALSRHGRAGGSDERP